MNSVRLRTLLVLGRVSNLPTLWSNCLAGWWLAGGGNFKALPWLLLGTSFLYVGGMYLNDAFDVSFDRQRRAERPIPSGKISLGTVWKLGVTWLALGLLFLFFISGWAGLLGLVLVTFIVVYNATHKFITASPWLMGACRFWVYVIAGTTGAVGLNGWPIVCGLALALYIVGLSYVARRESSRGPLPLGPLIYLAAPIILALLMNSGRFLPPTLVVAGVLAGWALIWVWPVLFGGGINVGIIVSNLLAGIVLVDWLAIAPMASTWLFLIYLALFSLTLLLQQFVPAT
jgi:4-hydroxybenzoate polyprenyltransferase